MIERIKNNLHIFIRVNKILLFALIAVAFTDATLQCFAKLYNNLNIFDYILLYVVSLSFVSLAGLILGLFINICILLSLYVKNSKLFLSVVSTIGLTAMNYIPGALILSMFISQLEPYFVPVTAILSLLVSASVCYIIVYNYKHLLEMMSYQKTPILILFFCFIVGIFDISSHLLNSLPEVTLYYFILSIIIAMLAVTMITYKSAFRQLDEVNFVYLLSIIILAIISTVPIFTVNPKLEASVKKGESFTKTAFVALNTLFDLDHDNFGPQLFLAGGDFANLDPEKNQVTPDYPENGIDENNFNGDLVRTYYLKYFKNQTTPEKLTGYNIVMITINNAKLPLQPTKTDFITSIINKSAYFSNAFATSDNKLSILKGIFTSHISNFTTLQTNKHILTQGKSLFEILKANNYNVGILLDVPYSAVMDFFDVYNCVDSFYANDYMMQQPVTSLNIFNTVSELSDKPYFLWIVFDTTVPVDFNKRLKSLMNGLKEIDQKKNTLFIINFIANEADYKNILDIKMPFLVYYEGIQPQVVNSRVSSFDILPTLLDLLGISYNTEGYTGQSLVKSVKNQGAISKRPVFMTQADRSLSVLLGNYLLRYNLGSNYKELFDIQKDPGLKRSLINKPMGKELPSLMDFIISQGNSK